MNLYFFIRGFVKFRIKVQNTERAICAFRNRISLRNIEVSEDCILSFICFYSEKQTAKLACDEINAEILEENSFGIPFLMSLLFGRPGLIAGFAAVVVIVVSSSLFVWDIIVEGNETVKSEEIIEALKENGFHIGMLKKSADLEESVNMLLVKDDRLSWAAINLEGTVAHVEVKEAAIGKMVEKKKNVNLIASHNGIVLRVDALEGEAEVKANDVVIKGQMLVSAFVEKRTGGNLLRGARGYVWANTERSYAVVVPLKYNEKDYTDKKNYKLSISILGKRFSINNPWKTDMKMSDFTVEKKSLALNKNLRLPVNVEFRITREYTRADKRRTVETALEIAKEESENRLFADSPGFKRTDMESKYAIDDDCLVYYCTFEGIENIAEPLEFQMSLTNY